MKPRRIEESQSIFSSSKPNKPRPSGFSGGVQVVNIEDTILKELRVCQEKGEGKQYEKKKLPSQWFNGRPHPKVRIIEVPNNPTWVSLFLKDEFFDLEAVILPCEEAFRKKDSIFDAAFQFCSVSLWFSY